MLVHPLSSPQGPLAQFGKPMTQITQKNAPSLYTNHLSAHRAKVGGSLEDEVRESVTLLLSHNRGFDSVRLTAAASVCLRGSSVTSVNWGR